MKETINQIFDTKEVNTGRQKEYDILRGILMVFIFFIHAYQTTLSERWALPPHILFGDDDRRSAVHFRHGIWNSLQQAKRTGSAG